MSAIAAIRRSVRGAMFDAFPRSRLVRRGPSAARRVALTFDDGPQPLTAAYLDVLDRAGVPATFFLMGDLSSERPALLREYLRRGHQIAGHGWDHLRFPTLSTAELRDQLRKTDAVLGPQPTGRPWVRPPYGALSPRVIAQLLGAGYTIALWSFESQDDRIKEADALVERVRTSKIKPGEVLLFHEGYQHTVDALPRIIAHLQGQGFECVTMADLFAA